MAQEFVTSWTRFFGILTNQAGLETLFSVMAFHCSDCTNKPSPSAVLSHETGQNSVELPQPAAGRSWRSLGLQELQCTHMIMNVELAFICLLRPFDLHNRLH